MNTVLRSAFALTAAAVAPPSLILVPMAADILSTVNIGSDTYAWVRFSRMAYPMLGTAAIAVVLFGLPTFLVFSWCKAIRWWSSVAMGFALGCLPVAVGSWPGDQSYAGSTASHWDGEKMVYTMIDGVATFEGWLQYLEIVGVFGAFGAVGGLAFWIVWRALQPRDRRTEHET